MPSKIFVMLSVAALGTKGRAECVPPREDDFH